MLKKILSVLLILVLTVSLVPLNVSNFNLVAYAATVKVTSAKIMVDGKEMTWDKTKYGKAYIHKGKYVYVPLKAFTTPFNLKYRLEKTRVKETEFSYYIVVENTQVANSVTLPLCPKLTENIDDGTIAMVNNQIYISVSVLSDVAVKMISKKPSGSTIAVSYKTPALMSQIKKISEVVKPLPMQVRGDSSDKLDKDFLYVSVGRWRDYPANEANYVKEKFFFEVGAVSIDKGYVGFTFNKQDEEAFSRVMMLTKMFLGANATQANQEYLQYFKKMGSEILLDKEAIGSDFTTYNNFKWKDSSNQKMTYLVDEKKTALMWDLDYRTRAHTGGKVSYTTISEYREWESVFLKNEETLTSLFETYVKNNYGKLNEMNYQYFKDPSLNINNLKTSDLVDMKMRVIVRPMEIMLIQDQKDDAEYYVERSMFDILHEHLIWEAYSLHTKQNAVGITLGIGLPNYTQLAKDLIVYTTGKKADATEIIGYRDKVMKAYYQHAAKTGDIEGYKFNTDVYPYVNKPYKLKSGTVVYMDFHGYYMNSVGPTVYIMKDLSKYNAPFVKYGYGNPESEYIFADWRVFDEKGREVRNSAPKFSWGIYGKLK